MNKRTAFLFDLNGTMVDDMKYHITAWHKIFNEFGAMMSYEEAKAECYGKNHEVIDRVLPGLFTEEEKDRMTIEKETKYQEAFRPQLKLIDGLDKFLEEAQQAGILMAIGSAAITFNIDFVLDGLNIRRYFSSIVSADDVKLSKPNPETYLKCAAQLSVHPENCIVFEDAPKGVEAAANAGMRSVVITTMHTKEEFSEYNNVISFIDDYKNINPHSLV